MAIAAGRQGNRADDDPAVVAKLVDLAATEIAGDPTMRHAVAMGLMGASAADRIVALTTHESPNVRLAACLAFRRRADRRIATCLADSSEAVVLEAARAIHDLPIAEAIPALAARAADGPVADPFLRRAISAAERVGTPESATTLFGVLGREKVPAHLRVMALDALRDWARPSPKNRVTNIWQPHALPRDPAVARAALEPARRD